MVAVGWIVLKSLTLITVSTTLTNSMIVLYSRGHKGVGVAHGITLEAQIKWSRCGPNKMVLGSTQRVSNGRLQ